MSAIPLQQCAFNDRNIRGDEDNDKKDEDEDEVQDLHYAVTIEHILHNDMTKLVGEISKHFYTLIATSENFPLKDSFLLDSASSIHVSRNRDRFINFRKAPPALRNMW